MNVEATAQRANRREGFRLRGTQSTRLEAFVDAAFAFAVTLLVISVGSIPETIGDLVRALRGVPAFGISFLMVAMFWLAHVRWSRRFGLDDAISVALSLTLVFLVLVFVYPLKMMFSSFMAWLSGGWLSPDSVAAAGAGGVGIRGVLAMFIAYGVVFVTLSACLAGLYLNAWRQRHRLALDADERQATMGDIYGLVWFVAVGVLSLVLALLLLVILPLDVPGACAWLVALPGMVYLLLSLTGVLDGVGRRRALAIETAQ